MSLFVTTKNRVYEVSDFQVMVITFLLSYYTVRVLKRVLTKYKEKQNVFNVREIRGGGFGVEIEHLPDNELAQLIMGCISDEQSYVVINEYLKSVIFRMVKANIHRESLRLTPNLIRFLASRILSKQENILVKFGNVLLSSTNRERLLVRTFIAAVLGLLAALGGSVVHGILMLSISYEMTSNCNFKCDDHFQHYPEHSRIVYADKPEGHVLICEDEKRLQIYIPENEKKFRGIPPIVAPIVAPRPLIPPRPLVPTPPVGEIVVPMVEFDKIPKRNFILSSQDARKRQLDTYNKVNEGIQNLNPRQRRPLIIEKSKPGTCSTLEKRSSRAYIRSRKQAKLVKFAKFKKTDPELVALSKMFNLLEEPEVPQQKCALNDIDNLID